MKLRKLARLCEHDELRPHDFDNAWQGVSDCPGGVFLPDDTLVVEKVDGEWPFPLVERIANLIAMNTLSSRDYNSPIQYFFKDVREILDALSVREAE